MNISEIKAGFTYTDSNGVKVEITALPGKLKSFQCTTSDRPGKILKITARQLANDIATAREIHS